MKKALKTESNELLTTMAEVVFDLISEQNLIEKCDNIIFQGELTLSTVSSYCDSAWTLSDTHAYGTATETS